VLVRRGREFINREQGQRIVVMSNVCGRGLGSFVAEVRSKLIAVSRCRLATFIGYGGQFENQERATRRLMVIVPVAIALITLFRESVVSGPRRRLDRLPGEFAR
jgi:cobalt-zinc-cadmium resistance protein CzcA